MNAKVLSQPVKRLKSQAQHRSVQTAQHNADYAHYLIMEMY